MSRRLHPTSPKGTAAFRFVITIGVLSLFAEVVYEGARSINGQFLESLGATAFIVGAVAGLAPAIALHNGTATLTYFEWETDFEGQVRVVRGPLSASPTSLLRTNVSGRLDNWWTDFGVMRLLPDGRAATAWATSDEKTQVGIERRDSELPATADTA